MKVEKKVDFARRDIFILFVPFPLLWEVPHGDFLSNNDNDIDDDDDDGSDNEVKDDDNDDNVDHNNKDGHSKDYHDNNTTKTATTKITTNKKKENKEIVFLIFFLYWRFIPKLLWITIVLASS